MFFSSSLYHLVSCWPTTRKAKIYFWWAWPFQALIYTYLWFRFSWVIPTELILFIERPWKQQKNRTFTISAVKIVANETRKSEFDWMQQVFRDILDTVSLHRIGIRITCSTNNEMFKRKYHNHVIVFIIRNGSITLWVKCNVKIKLKSEYLSRNVIQGRNWICLQNIYVKKRRTKTILFRFVSFIFEFIC